MVNVTMLSLMHGILQILSQRTGEWKLQGDGELEKWGNTGQSPKFSVVRCVDLYLMALFSRKIKYIIFLK